MNLPGAPAHIRAEAGRGVVVIPKMVVTNREAMQLIAALRRSEIRKARALRQAVDHSDGVRRAYAKKGRK